MLTKTIMKKSQVLGLLEARAPSLLREFPCAEVCLSVFFFSEGVGGGSHRTAGPDLGLGLLPFIRADDRTVPISTLSGSISFT